MAGVNGAVVDKKPKWTELNDLANEDVGGSILFSTDDWFAEAENLLSGSEPIWKEGFTEQGKWMDGWETRRKRIPGHDWCIIRLGMKGVIHGVELGTDFFTGNYAPKFSIQGARLEDETGFPERVRSRGQAASHDQLQAMEKMSTDKWTELIPVTTLGSGYKETSRTLVEVESRETYSHIRLNMYPDGGIARIRVFGVCVPDTVPRPDELVDLVSAELGGVCVGYSNAHYGHPRNMIRFGRGKDMGDGWETARRLDRPSILEADENGILKIVGSEFAIFRVGYPGIANNIVIDTNHFKGNYPDSAIIEGLFTSDENITMDRMQNMIWKCLLPAVKLQPHKIHYFSSQELEDIGKISHIRVKMFPDGGISRVRIFGFVQQ